MLLGALTLELLACSVHGPNMFLWSGVGWGGVGVGKCSQTKSSICLSRLRLRGDIWIKTVSTAGLDCPHLDGGALIDSNQSTQSHRLDTVIDLLFGHVTQISLHQECHSNPRL